MALVTLGGYPVTGGVLCLPLAGAWHADVAVDADATLSGALTLKAGTLELRGTVAPGRAGAYAGAQRVRLVGGAGGMSRPAKAQGYLRATARHVVEDLLRAAGETLAASSDASALREQLPSWGVGGGAPVGVELARVLAALRSSPSWRFLPDGSLWIGAETWPVSALADYQVTSQCPEEAAAIVAPDAPTLLPGATLDGRRVEYVEHDLGGDAGIRSRVWFSS